MTAKSGSLIALTLLLFTALMVQVTSSKQNWPNDNLIKSKLQNATETKISKNYSSISLRFLTSENVEKNKNITSKQVKLKDTSAQNKFPDCPEKSPQLLGPLRVIEDFKEHLPDSKEFQNWFGENLKFGGIYQPPNCVAKQKVAIIVPFRDRSEHLRIFLHHIHPVLQRQLLDYQIFVIEQSQQERFNRGILMNIGYVEALKIQNFDCFIFHDVDLLTEDDRFPRTCTFVLRQVRSIYRLQSTSGTTVFNTTTTLVESVPFQKGNTHLPSTCACHSNFPPALLLPASILFLLQPISPASPDQFSRMNGYANTFYGWGGEDDDLNHRIYEQNYTIIRSPTNISRFYMQFHQPSDKNDDLDNLMEKSATNKLAKDGLSSLSYKKLEAKELPLYTWFLVQIPPGPKKHEVDIVKNIANDLWSGASLLSGIFQASAAMMRPSPSANLSKTDNVIDRIY